MPWALSMRRLPSDYNPAIDGLRAIAVVAIILFHLDARWLPGGLAGVDLFFVISGFVICRSLAAAPCPQLWPWLLDFLRRRLLRLLPLLLVVVVATFAAVSWHLPRGILDGTYENTGLAAMAGASNLVLAWSLASHLTPFADANPFLQTWPLAVQAQFYLLLPLLIFAWLHRRPACWALPVLALASLLLAAWQTRAAPASAYYLLPARFWQFAAGALLYQHVHRCTLPGARRYHGWAGLALVVAGLAMARPATLPFPDGVIVVTGAALLLAACTTSTGTPPLLVRWLGCAPMRYLGRLAYALYLVHWPVLVLMRGDQPLPLSALPVYVPLVLGLAMLGHHLIERPLRYGHWPWQRAPWSVFGATLAAVAVGLALIGLLDIG